LKLGSASVAPPAVETAHKESVIAVAPLVAGVAAGMPQAASAAELRDNGFGAASATELRDSGFGVKEMAAIITPWICIGR